jgi:hypothetical protein
MGFNSAFKRLKGVSGVNIKQLGNKRHIMNVYRNPKSDSAFLASEIDALVSQIIR